MTTTWTHADSVANPRDGTVAANWSDGVPGAGDSILYDNTEGDLTGGALPNVMPAVHLAGVTVQAAYTLSAGVAKDLTDFAGTSTWNDFLIGHVV